MSHKERLDKLESDLRALDRKVWLTIIVVIILLLKGDNGALIGILTGASISEVNSMANEALYFGLAAAAGSAFRAYLGYASKSKKKGIAFDWSMFAISVLPSIVAAFGTGLVFDMEINLQNVILVFFGAAGFNSLQDKFGLQKKK